MGKAHVVTHMEHPSAVVQVMRHTVVAAVHWKLFVGLVSRFVVGETRATFASAPLLCCIGPCVFAVSE